MLLKVARKTSLAMAITLTTLCAPMVFYSSSAAAAKDVAGNIGAYPDGTWQTDGIIWSMASSHGVVYVGGSFSAVRPPGAAPGEQEVKRRNFAAFDAETGTLLPCAPDFAGGADTIRALKTSPDGQVLYVGGSFDQVNSTAVASAVALDTSSCALRSDFRPAMSATVRAIEVSPTAIYLGGDFSLVNGQIRNHIAAFTPQGSLLPFSADFDLPVRALSFASSREKILVGGDFNWVNGRAVHALVALDTTGATEHTYPDWIPAASVVKALANDGDQFYVGAEGTGGGVFDGRIAGRLESDQMVWKDSCLGATQAIVPYKGLLYSGSHAHDCSSTPGGFPETGRRQYLLAQSLSNGEIQHWFPNTDGGLGEGAGPRAMTVADDILWVGGEFTKVNDMPQQSLTRFRTGSVSASPEETPVLSASASASSAGIVTVSWPATWDRDTRELTYRVYRDGKRVYSKAESSTFWDLPRMSYSEFVPSGNHQYRIDVTDGPHTTPKSQPVDVIVPR
ncbi:fibronectin type III domain-containing protein [Streptomyces sp. NPDC048362]|uniref:fibronectin type III domain-containing protein n=1 Tax=Streptomyces sp. NPDC048362 TaxID=3365539 RepID=UPI00371B5620